MPKMIIRIKDASHAEVVGTLQHHEIMKAILSYSSTYARAGKLYRTKFSMFRNGKFGLGLISYIKEKLNLNEEPFEIIIPNGFKPLPIKPTENIKLGEKVFEKYQIKALNLLDSKVKRGIIQSPTASGKTTIAAGIIDKLNRPTTLIVVPTKDIARNTVSSLEKDLEINIGLIGDKVCLIDDITVCLYQSLRNIIQKNKLLFKKLTEETRLVIWDEAHLASKAIQECLSPFTNTYYRFGLTATPKLKYKKQMYFEITGQLGPVVMKITEKQAEKRVVSDIKCIMWKFYDEPTQDKYMKKYRKDILLNKRRCKLLCEMVQYSFQTEKRFSCLLLVDEFEQAKLIAKYAPLFDIPEPVIVWSGLTTDETQEIKEALNSTELPFIIATPKFSVGTDIPEVETIVLGSARKSIDNLAQKIGRGRRKTKGKRELLLMDCYDVLGEDDRFFEKYSIIRMKFYERKKWFKGVTEGKYSI